MTTEISHADAPPDGSRGAGPSEPHKLPSLAAPKRAGGLYVLGLVVVGAALLGAFTLSTTRKQAESADADTRNKSLQAGPKVFTGKVEMTPALRTVTLSGEVRAFRATTLYAKVSGYLKSVSVDRGDRVKAGQVLGLIEAPEAEKQVSAQEADLAIKQLNSTRFAALAPTGTVSAQERDRAAADVNISQAELERLRILRGYEIIRAPFEGMITARFADPGALLQATGGGQALVEVAQVDRVRIFTYLAQPEAVAVHEGDLAEVWTDETPDHIVQAQVTRRSGELDQRSRTMLTEVDVDNRDAAFLPGTFVHVRLSLKTPQGLAMPSEALAIKRAQPMAAVVINGHVKLVPIKIGTTDGPAIRVLDGLHEGDVVVLHPGEDVIDGGAVQATPAPPKP